MKHEITRRQTLAWVFAAVSAPVVMRCSVQPWNWVLAGCAFAAAYYIIICILRRFAGEDRTLTELTVQAFGSVGGKVLLVLTALWTLLALAAAAAESAQAFPNGREAGLSGVVLLVLAALAASRGTAASARCAAVLAPVLAVLYAVLLASALPQVRSAWCAPSGTWKSGFSVLQAMLLPSAVLFLPTQSGKPPFRMLAVLTLAPALFALVTAGTLSPQVTAAEPAAFYTLAKSLHLFSFFQRFEPLVSTVLYAALFCMAILLVRSADTALTPVLGERRWLPAAFCAAAFAARYALPLLPPWGFAVGAAVFWGVFPMLTLLVVAVKIVRKKAKKTVDKPDGL